MRNDRTIVSRAIQAAGNAGPRAALLTSALLSALVAPTIHAATSTGANAGSTIETVVVTGTRGRERSTTDTPVPVDVINAEQIATAGALGGELAQVLQTLVPSFTLQRQSNSGSADLVRPAQLRGMSPDQVLVLVNGKRRHTTSITGIDAKTGRGTAPVDFNSLPNNAIGQIEILRDGAAAQYGSDAIAGVINIILDERPEGVDLAVTYGRHQTDFSPTGNSIQDGDTVSVQGSFGTALGQDGFLRAGFELRDRDQTNRAGFDLVPFFEDEANVELVGGRRNFRPGDADTEDRNLWVNLGTTLTDAVSLYGFSTYNDRDAEGTGFFRYPVSSANILSVHPLGYRPVTTGDNRDLAATLGLRGNAAAWNWDTSLSWGENRFRSGVRNSLNPSLGIDSPSRFFSGETRNDLLSLNIDLDRPMDIGLATPATLAIGAEYRHHGFESRAGDPESYIAGPFADTRSIGAQAGSGLRPEETRDLDRDVVSLYAELSADLSDRVFTTLSARYEDSDDFGDTLSGKLAARWEFVDGFALRGAVSNSFRAPSLVQLGFGTSSTSFGAGGALTTVNTLPVDDALAQALGARDLKEESSTNFSVGFVAQPLDGLTITLDAFRIDVDDRITLSERIDCNAGTVPAGAATLCASRNITAANFFTNAVDTRTEGVELVVTYVMPLLDGSLDLSLAYANAETEIRRVNDPLVAGVILVGVEERNTIEDATPEDKAILTASWRNETWSLLTRATYFGEATRVFNFGGGFEPEQTYGSAWQVDLEGGYALKSGLELFVGASNLFDQYPDKSDSLINYFDNLPYDVLSPIGFNGRFIYGGARISF